MIKRTTIIRSDSRWKGSSHGLGSGDAIQVDKTLFSGPQTADGFLHQGLVLGQVAGGSYGAYAGNANAVQTVALGAASAGTVTIGFDGSTTAAIPFSANAAAIQAALDLLPNVLPGDIVVTGGPFPAAVTLTFGGRYAGVAEPAVTVTPTGLTGGAVAVVVVTAGGPGASNGLQTPRYFLMEDVDITTFTGPVFPAVGMWHGEVIEAFLPTGHGLDDVARAALRNIKFI